MAAPSTIAASASTVTASWPMPVAPNAATSAERTDTEEVDGCPALPTTGVGTGTGTGPGETAGETGDCPGPLRAGPTLWSFFTILTPPGLRSRRPPRSPPAGDADAPMIVRLIESSKR